MQSEKLEDLLNLSLSVSKEARMQSEALREGYQEQSDTWELIIKYSGEAEEISGAGFAVEELISGYGIVTVLENEIPRLASLPAVEYIEKPKRLLPQLVFAFRDSCFYRELSLTTKIEEQTGLGEGVYIAVLDSGIDYTQSVFRKDGKLTIAWLWDQTKGADPNKKEKAPEGFEIGVEYDRKQLLQNLTDAKEAGKRLSEDVSGHGTMVSIIAQKGAPRSELIVVKLDTGNQKSYPSTTSLMRGITYAIRKALADGKPLVMNLSYGNTYGSHSGTSLLERFLDNASEIGRNVICVGSGNEGVSGGHFSGDLKTLQKVDLSVGAYERTVSLQLWQNPVDSFLLTIRSPEGEEYSVWQQQFFNRQDALLSDGLTRQFVLSETKFLMYLGNAKPYQTLKEWYFELEGKNDYVQTGIWTFFFTPKRIVNGAFQMYLPSQMVRSENTKFLIPDPEQTITIPATASKVISVGAYDSRYRSYADFSGRGQKMEGGYLTDLFQKPDLVAPGVNLEIPLDEEKRIVSGTSFATPFVSAAAACLMSEGIIEGTDPYLYAEKVKATLIAAAKLLPGYQKWPNEEVGWGALCIP